MFAVKRMAESDFPMSVKQRFTDIVPVEGLAHGFAREAVDRTTGMLVFLFVVDARNRARNSAASGLPFVLPPDDVVEAGARRFLVVRHAGRPFVDCLQRMGDLRADDEMIDRLASQMSSCVLALSRQHLVHRDLSPENLLIDDDCDVIFPDLMSFERGSFDPLEVSLQFAARCRPYVRDGLGVERLRRLTRRLTQTIEAMRPATPEVGGRWLLHDSELRLLESSASPHETSATVDARRAQLAVAEWQGRAERATRAANAAIETLVLGVAPTLSIPLVIGLASVFAAAFLPRSQFGFAGAGPAGVVLTLLSFAPFLGLWRRSWKQIAGLRAKTKAVVSLLPAIARE